MQRYFPPEAKAKIQALVDELVKAFNKRIDALSWMSAETKVKAKQKVATLKVGVGYPDHWEDYSGLKIVKGDAFGNAQRAELFQYRREREKLHQPIDRGEWWMTPQTVNAVNLPIQNALNFPAAFLQPPFFDPNADAAHNYGAVGAVIGHEISRSVECLDLSRRSPVGFFHLFEPRQKGLLRSPAVSSLPESAQRHPGDDLH